MLDIKNKFYFYDGFLGNTAEATLMSSLFPGDPSVVNISAGLGQCSLQNTTTCRVCILGNVPSAHVSMLPKRL